MPVVVVVGITEITQVRRFTLLAHPEAMAVLAVAVMVGNQLLTILQKL
jgi:hypothetical protein